MSGGRDGGSGQQRRRARSANHDDRTNTDAHRDDGDDYEVGFRKPPRSTRFKKGRSGNPRGRPRKPKPEPISLADAPADTFLEREAYRLLKFRENGQEVELPVSQAVLRAMFAGAVKGNRLSQRYAIEYLERKETRYHELRMQRFVRLGKLKAEGEAQIANHRKRGLPPPDLLPHPEDIVLNYRTGEAEIHGPETREDLRDCAYTAELRDLCMMQAALTETLRRKARVQDKDNISLPMVLAQLADSFLPRRLRWSKVDELVMFMGFMAEDRRKLEGRIQREMARLERERPPSLLNDAQRELTDWTVQTVRDQLWPEAEEG